MKKVVFLLLLLINFTVFSSEVKVPEVVFPIEITTEKIEEKPILQSPEKMEFTEKLQFPLFVEEIPPNFPYDVKPPIIRVKKPSSFLGIPPENSLMAEAIEDFENERFISSKEKLEKLIKKFPDAPFIGEAYYLYGLSNFNLGDRKKAIESFVRTCEKAANPYVKNYGCISAVILYLKEGNISKAERLLKNIDLLDENTLFWHSVIFAYKKDYKQSYNILKDIKCQNLEINFIDYCKYMKGYLLFANRKFDEALKLLKNLKSSIYWKHTLLLKGYIYLNKRDYPKASAYFKKFLEGYGSVEKISDYAIYGLGLINLRTGDVSKAIEKAGILESRNRNLAQNLYIQIAEYLADRGDFKTAFAILQKSAKTGGKYIAYLQKKIAITAYNTGNYKYAYLMFKNIKDPEFSLYAGYALLKLGKPVKAVEYFEKAKESEDESIKLIALKYLADVYFQLKDFKNYLKVVKEIGIYDKNYARNLLGWYFFSKKEYKKAYQAFTDPYMKAVSAFNANLLKEAYLLVKDKKDRKSRFLLAYLYLKKDKPDLAREVLLELSKGNDDIAKKAAYLYAYTYFSEGNYQKAVEEFKKFAEKYPETKLGKQAILRMADSYYNLGETDLARQIYKNFIKKYSNTPEAIDAAYQLVILEMKSAEGNIPEQINSFIKKYPNYPLVNLLKVQLADYYLENKDFDKAEEIYKELIKKDVKESDYAFYKLGYLYYMKKEYEKAKQILNEYIKKFPNGEYSITAKSLLAKIYQETGNLDKAIAILKDLPDTDENRYKLAILYYKKGDLVEAKNYFEDIYTRFPKYRNDIAYYLGKIQIELGDLELAKKYLEEAISGSDYNHVAESYFLLGVLQEKAGDIENAINSYINVIYLYPEAKEFVIKARLKAAEIMKKKGQKKEAACMLKPILNTQLDGKLKRKLKTLLKGLPECR